MKFEMHPLYVIFSILTILTIVFGLTLEEVGLTILYSPELYLLFCIASALHFLEENHLKSWKIPEEVFNDKIPSFAQEMKKSTFVKFSHLIVLTNFFFYFLISNGERWAMVYGLVISFFFGVGNGIAHVLIYFRTQKNTGMFTGFFQLVFGGVLWMSFLINFLSLLWVS